MENLRLPCLYSYGCRMAREKKLQNIPVQVILLDKIDRRKKFSDEETIAALQELQSYHAYRLIAISKSENDIFNEAVVRSYWLGNQSPNSRETRMLNHNHATLEKVKTLITSSLKIYRAKIRLLLDCSISWGRIIKINSDKIEVFETGLVLRGDKIILTTEKKQVLSEFLDKKEIKKDNLISIHLSSARETISQDQATILNERTLEVFKKFNF